MLPVLWTFKKIIWLLSTVFYSQENNSIMFLLYTSLNCGLSCILPVFNIFSSIKCFKCLREFICLTVFYGSHLQTSGLKINIKPKSMLTHYFWIFKIKRRIRLQYYICFSLFLVSSMHLSQTYFFRKCTTSVNKIKTLIPDFW